MGLKEMFEEYVSLREKRIALEQQADDIKNGREGELKKAITLEMSAQGMKTANFEGLGRITVRNKSFYEIQDAELFTRGLLQSIITAGKAGRPLSDGLFVQKRISSDALETILEENAGDVNFSMERFGIGQITRQELSVTKR